MKKRALSKRKNKQRIILASCLLAVFGGLGLLALRGGSAAVSVATSEAENGTANGNAVDIASAGASGGQAVKFSDGGSSPPPGNVKPGFLYRQGRNFMLDGKVHRAAAVNNFALTGCHHGYAPSQAEMDSYFSKMKAGAMVRTWAFSQSNGTLIERTIRTAEKYNVKLILALADGAEYCGSPDFDGGWYSGGFKGAYFSWISSVVPKYKDSPAVGAWEIMNEPALKGGTVSESTIKSFFDQTAAHIKSKDPNHMVSTGTLAPWMSEHKGADGYTNVHSSPNIDIISLHEYDYAYQSSRTLISPHYGPTKQAAERLQKPIIVGEAGITLASGCMTQQERANAFKQKVDAYLTQGASAVFFWGITWPPNEDTVCNEPHGSNDPVNGAVQNMVNGYTPPN